MGERAVRISVLGGYGVGHSMRVARCPEAGETLSDGVLSIGHGGKGSNQAVAARRLGAQVALLTAVGQDVSGEGAFALWSAEGVDADAVRRSAGAATMTGWIIVEPSGENRIIIARGALDTLTEADAERFRPAIHDSDLLLVSLEIPTAVATAALRIAHEEGVRSVLNPAPAQAATAEMCRLADVITPNLTEALALTGHRAGAPTSDPETLARDLRARFGTDVVMTLGTDGSVVATGDGTVAVPAVPAERVVDTTGAGDTFSAALAVAWLETGSLPAAVRYAALAGSYVVARAEVIPALPHRADLPDPTTLTT